MTVRTAHISVQVAASPLPVTLMISTIGRTTVPRNSVSFTVQLALQQATSQLASNEQVSPENCQLNT